jgi:hypothetical protein
MNPGVHGRALLALCCIGFFILPVFAPAQSASGDEQVFLHPLTATTRPRFEAAAARLAQAPVVRGRFELRKTIRKLNRPIVSSGAYLISAGDGMVWYTQKPFPSTMVLGRNFILQTTPDGTRVRLSAEGNEAFLRIAEIMNALFAGDTKTLTAHFDVCFTETGGVWNLGLISKDAAVKNAAARILMTGSDRIHALVLYQQNGDMITYLFEGQEFSNEARADEKALFKSE